GRRGRTTVAAEAGGTGAGDGDDVARRLEHLPHAVPGRIGDEDVAAAVHRDRLNRGNAGRGGRAAVPAVGRGAVAGDGDDVAGGLDDFTDAVAVGDEDVAVGVHRYRGRVVEPGGGRRSAVAAEAGRARAGDGNDVAGRLDDLADAVVEGVRD